MQDTNAACPATVVVVVDGPLTFVLELPQAVVRPARMTVRRAKEPSRPYR
jgi:hypothetical protein